MANATKQKSKTWLWTKVMGLAFLVFLVLWGLLSLVRWSAEGTYVGTVQRAYEKAGEYRVEFNVEGQEDPLVFTNEDSWLYFKRNSGDVHAKLNQFADQKAKVELKSWGWRNSWFSWFPNVVKIHRLE